MTPEPFGRYVAARLLVGVPLIAWAVACLAYAFPALRSHPKPVERKPDPFIQRMQMHVEAMMSDLYPQKPIRQQGK